MRFSISLSSTILLSCRIACACSGGDERYFSPLIGIELLSDTGSLPAMFYHEVPRYKLESFYPIDSTKLNPISTGLIQEWKSRYPKADTLDIRDLLFSNHSNNFEDDFFNAHPFGIQLKSADRSYFRFAKRCEGYANVSAEEYWGNPNQGTEKSDEQIADMIALSEEGRNELPALGDDSFLRQRYIYQVVRMLHYVGKPQEAINNYEELKGAEGTKTLTWWRTKGIVAGALRKVGQNARAKYEFAAIFNGSPALGPMAYRNCKYIDSATFNEALELTSDPQERSALHFIRQVYDNALDLDILEKIYSETGTSDRLEVAVLKQLTNIETNIYYPWLTKSLGPIVGATGQGGEELWKIALGKRLGVQAEPISWWSRIWSKIFAWVTRVLNIKVKTASTLENDGIPEPVNIPLIVSATWKETETTGLPSADGRIKDFQGFCAKIAAAKNTRNPGLFHCAAGFAALMRSDWDNCLKHSASAKAVPGVKTATARDADFLALYARVRRGDKVDATFENELKTFLIAPRTGLSSDDAQRTQLGMETARSYINDNRITRAAAILAHVKNSSAELLDIYLPVTAIDSLIALRKSPNATAYERLILDSLPQDNVLQEIAGTKLLRSGDFSGAAKRFEACGTNYWKKSKTIINTNAEGPPINSRVPPIAMNKFEFVQQAVVLQKDSSFVGKIKLGNLFLHDCYWAYVGQLWTEDGKSIIDLLRQGGAGTYPFNTNPEFLTEFENRKSIFQAQYTSQQMAAKFYKAALDKAGDDEEKGLAIFSIAQAIAVNWTSVENVNRQADTKLWFSKLKDIAGQTQFFEEAASQCTKLQDFL